MVHGTNGDVPDYQLSAWLMAIFLNGMDAKESHWLTQAMLHSGDVVDLSEIGAVKVDKHSTGGVGDKMSIALAPIVAAAGVPVPMISGRGLGHTGGTLDKLESIPGFRVDYDTATYKKLVRENGCCLIGQTARIAPADKKLYALRDVTATVQSIPLIAASIMSKKLAEGIDALVLDVKTGSGAFMQEYDRSKELARTLVQIGTEAGKETIALITDMNQPLGNAVGNWLEVRECIDILHGEGPPDSTEITIALAAEMLLLGKKADNRDEGEALAREMVSSGKAWQKLLQIVRAQEGDTQVLESPDSYPKAAFKKEVAAKKSGYISAMNAQEIGLCSVQLGAGRQKWEDKIDPAAGIMMHKKMGDRAEKGDTLATLYTEKEGNLAEAEDRFLKAFTISDTPAEKPKLVYERLDSGDL